MNSLSVSARDIGTLAQTGVKISPAQNDVTSFTSEEFGNIRVLDIDGEPWFVAKDVAMALGYSNPLKAVRDHVCDEDKGVNDLFTPNGGVQQTIIINESGLYSLILSSKLEGAQQFKRWVTCEVLPSVRKTGRYVAPSAPAQLPQELELRRRELETKSKEVELERARFLRSMSLSYRGKSETYPQVLDAYAVHEIVGSFALPLPEIRQRLMSAGEVGKILGISANKVGSIANRHNLKVEENGAWVRDKSRYSAKEVDTFRYNEAGLEKVRECMNKEESND